MFNWKVIWENVAFRFINSDDRSIIFKYMHEILPNKLKLYNMKKILSPNCSTCNIEENNLHMMYYCRNNTELVQYMRGLINICINRNGVGMIKLLFLDTSGLSKRDSNTAVVLLVIFICTIWYQAKGPGSKEPEASRPTAMPVSQN